MSKLKKNTSQDEAVNKNLNSADKALQEQMNKSTERNIKLEMTKKSKGEKLLKHIRNISLSLFFSFFVSAILLLIIYLFIPNSSYISLIATPKQYVMEEFSGGMVANVRMLEVNYGTLQNQDDILVCINDQQYCLKPYELKIEFNENKDIDKYGIPYANLLSFNSQVSAYTISSEGYNFKNTKVSIEKSPKLLGKSFGKSSSEEIICSVELESLSPSNLYISVLNNSKITANGGVDVWVKGKKMPTYAQITVLKQINSQIINSTFLLTSNKYKIHRYQDDYIFLEGQVKSFSGISDKNAVLKQTYLNQQKEYDVATLKVDGNYHKNLLDFEYEVDNLNSNLVISGGVKGLNVADTSLYFSFLQFIIQNLGAVISAVFTAFIITYIPYTFSKKNTNTEI